MDKRKGYVLLLINAGVRSSEKKYKKTNNDQQNIHIKLSNINPSSNNKTLNARLLARVITGSYYT
jgi:hypothetical protein